MSDLEIKFERIYNRSPNFINFWNTQICVDPYILIFLVVFGLFGVLAGVLSDVLFGICNLNNLQNILYNVLLVITAVGLTYTAVVAHELGHFAVRKYQGCKVDCMLLSYNLCCVVSDFDDNELSDSQIFLGVFAGPFVNLILSSVCFLLLAIDTVNGYLYTVILGFALVNSMVFIVNTFNTSNHDSDGYKIFKYLKSVV